MRPRDAGREAGMLMAIMVAIDRRMMTYRGRFATLRSNYTSIGIARLITIAILVGAYAVLIAGTVRIVVVAWIVIPTVVGIV